jgi:outer membrane protein TolC
VSLTEAIQVAHQNHGRVAVAEESVAASRQRVRQARTGNLPSISAELGFNTRGTSSLGGLFGPDPTQTVIGPGGTVRRQSINTDTSSSDRGVQPRVTFSFTPFDGGLTRANVRQARANVEGNLASLTGVRNDLALEVATNYLAQLRAERLLDLRVEQERLARTQLESVEAKIAAGETAEADRALPLSELRNRQVDRIQAENDVRVAANALRNSMGLQTGPSLRLVELQENTDPLPPEAVYEEMARRGRPEVVQAEAQVRAAEASVAIARISRKPRFDTTFTYNLTPNNEFSRSDYSFGAAISMPLWDAGLSQAREEEARSGVSSAAANLEQIKKDVAADVQQAYFNLVNARERLGASRLAVAAARVNLEATTARYQRGVAGQTVVELIQAQVQFATAGNSAINALYDIHLAQAQLNRAIGRTGATPAG